MLRRVPAKNLAAAALFPLVFFLMAAGDLALRSREAFAEAGRQESWRDNPALKAAALEAEFKLKYSALDRRAAAGKLTPGEAARAAALLEADKDLRLSESSAKLAYIWYKSAARDFRSPFNPWAEKAEERLPAALAAWRAELAAENIKAEPWMTE